MSRHIHVYLPTRDESADPVWPSSITRGYTYNRTNETRSKGGRTWRRYEATVGSSEKKSLWRSEWGDIETQDGAARDGMTLKFTETSGNAVVKVYWNSDEREFICRLFVDGKENTAASYFTDDLEDAKATAKDMVRRASTRDSITISYAQLQEKFRSGKWEAVSDLRRSGSHGTQEIRVVGTGTRMTVSVEGIPEASRDAGDIKIVYNKLLGGWYVVRGPHQTPLNGRFNSKEEAEAWLRARAGGAG